MSLLSYINSVLNYLKEQNGSELGKSSLGIKYPTFRDHPLHTGSIWLNGKRADDGADGLWRVHDGLYDLEEFIHSHPGGADWLKMTKGTDITEAFESHHLSPLAETQLSKYFIRKTTQPRNYPFTFNENDFYKTLKRRIYEKLKTLPPNAENRSKLLTDSMAVSYLILASLSVYFHSFFLGLLAGVVLCLTTIAAHNFFHQKDNFRMYYFNLSLLQARNWRISHALSHHMYTNTISDLEISSLEPHLQYLPKKKNFYFRYLSWAYSLIVYALLFIGQSVQTHLDVLFSNEKYHLDMLIPFTIIPFIRIVTNESLLFCILMFVWIQICGSFHFSVVGVNAAHHHPQIFHDGDKPRQNKDWGLFQMDTVMDRKDITDSHFLVLTNFGDHALHHLFPTIDHGYLNDLYPVFLETCEEFGINWRLVTQFELVKGQYQQLARIEPNKQCPS